MASNFLSVIGRSTGDYELKKKIRNSGMAIEIRTALIHEHMYDRLNDSNDSNDGREKTCARKTTQTEMLRKDQVRESKNKTRHSKVHTKK